MLCCKGGGDHVWGQNCLKLNKRIESYNCSVADPDPDPNPDPDPPDPRVFGPPGSF